MALTNMAILNAKPDVKDYKLSDGKSLHLLVKKSGSKYWRWSYRYDGKQKTLAIGVYPEVSIKVARDKVDRLRVVLSDGLDPSQYVNDIKKKHIAASYKGMSVSDALSMFFKEYCVDKDDKSIRGIDGLIRNWIKPAIGNVACVDINAQDVLGIVRGIEKKDMRPTAHKVATLLKQFFAFCIAEPTIQIDRNWMLDVISLLKPLPESHHPALITPTDVAQLLGDIDGSKSYWTTKIAIRLSINWFVRPGELRKLLWQDINWAMECVQISKSEMKKTSSSQDHWIPFTRQTKEMLQFLLDNNRTSAFVFPSIRNLHKPMSENTVNGAIRNMGYQGKQTAHGLRATARTLLDEELKQNPNYIEHQLAHRVKDANGRAYNRTTQLNERRVMLQLWSDYLDELEYKAKNGIEVKSAYEQAIMKGV
ncbi:hypothetical protein BAE46_01060 [Glaciecola punicea]|jgi:integrase|uniref:tyrosine-type recombinase/integrase n=1 Tax=Glaciecola punicea TaxID=56804 RepID=UPI0008728A21|nr:integrase arm-type DNA-binding domain-containing protein [Glaciecola punicea]OFA33332.1 hypothetical protein BAE46_01060 [Glaciecola punicea]